MDNESNLFGNMEVAEEPPGKWNDWKWQLRNRIQSVGDAAKKGLPISQEASQTFPFSITPYYLSLIEQYNSSDPIYRMCVPDIAELSGDCCVDDPLQEDQQMPVPHLVHRYRDRALIICTAQCSVYCRYCTRKRTVGSPFYCNLTDGEVADIKEYLKNHPEITDVILSGGDPLLLDRYDIRFILSQVRAVESVQIIRIGTKVPVVLPMRIDDELVETLKDFQPVFVNTHFNHPREITAQSQAACAKLIDNGIPVNNQSVLLKGVNDDKFIQEELCRKLVRMRVRPYYLFQCDIVNGANHFRTKVAKGIEIMEHLRGRLSGLAIPQYVIDTPGGKIPILPTYLISQTPEKVILRNFEGKIMEYPEI
ncbi:MAG: KamA family radical SAM protein [Proteobacteria bacterium]|jgi:lysine 2,3-aminomutase|nr:KamA family radical SAM protein [Pseudomonadota bacterium]